MCSGYRRFLRPDSRAAPRLQAARATLRAPATSDLPRRNRRNRTVRCGVWLPFDVLLLHCRDACCVRERKAAQRPAGAHPLMTLQLLFPKSLSRAVAPHADTLGNTRLGARRFLEHRLAHIERRTAPGCMPRALRIVRRVARDAA